MNTNPLYDAKARMFQDALDSAVDFLLPVGSGTMRLLHFKLEAVNDRTGESIKYGVVYCRPYNYTKVYGYLAGEEDEVVVQGESHNWGTWKSLPVNSVTIDDQGRILKDTATGGLLTGIFSVLGKPEFLGNLHTTRAGWGTPGRKVVIPGSLVTYADHDTCWRDYGIKTIERLDRVDEKLEKIDIFEITRFKVLSISIEGEKGERFEYNVADGEWINPDPENTCGAFAVYQGMMALAHCADRQRTLRFRVDWRLYEEREARPEPGKDYEGAYNYRRHIADVTPRTEDWWTPLKGGARLWFDDQGNVIRFHNKDIDPVPFTRDFVMTAWDLPKTDYIYALEGLDNFLDSGTFNGENHYNHDHDYRQPSLEIPHV